MSPQAVKCIHGVELLIMISPQDLPTTHSVHHFSDIYNSFLPLVTSSTLQTTTPIHHSGFDMISDEINECAPCYLTSYCTYTSVMVNREVFKSTSPSRVVESSWHTSSTPVARIWVNQATLRHGYNMYVLYYIIQVELQGIDHDTLILKICSSL